MRFLPHTPEDIADMLAAVGARHIDELFQTIPEGCRHRNPIDVPAPLSEIELNAWMDGVAATTAASPTFNSFLGAGRYDHFIPHIIPFLVNRSEFATSYTPYQPEVSQGTLQAIYEYQTLTARLLGLDVANASIYDGASALAEALLMAVRITKRDKIAISRFIHPSFRQVIDTYLKPTGITVIDVGRIPAGRTDIGDIQNLEDPAAVVVQSPNFFGCIEALRPLANAAHAQGALFVTCFTEALAYGLLKTPGEQDADIACGEGQSLGIPMTYGGPGVGMLACRAEHVRSLPGRLVGKTTDLNGQRGFVLTLATREQHIRREKATSNICTNSSLCALTAVAYMAAAGKDGLRELAQLNHDKTEYAKTRLVAAGAELAFGAPVFNEFVVRFKKRFEPRYRELFKKKIIAGLPLAPYFPELKDHYLFTVTETKTREQIDALAAEVAP